MQFGEIPVADAQGAILAHSVRHRSGVFKKGHSLSAQDSALLISEGVERVFAVRLEADDVAEDDAAASIAEALAGANTKVRDAATGRANIMSAVHGVAVIDAVRINQLNAVHESITVATVGVHEVIDDGQMVATVKIIPYAVPRSVLNQALGILNDGPALSMVALQRCKVALIMTRVAGTKASLISKATNVISARVEALGSALTTIKITDHRTDAVCDAIAEAVRTHDVVLVLGASAIADRGDVVPAGLVDAGGEVIHLGMPVDPGNLLMFGRLGEASVIGVPSCARSPKTNGFDWVLSRVLAGLAVTPRDIMEMGVGGLLQEISSRPLPREAGR